jgi:protein-L-isoaspartate(D-aspartate) O-methyltransferase
MLTPKMEARILQELRIKKTDKILEVGSGSGYMTALLAELGAQVYSVEIVPTLCSIAKMNLQTHGITNVTLEQGDAAQGWPQHGPYDVIVLTASTPILPEAFQKSLNPGGRLFAIVGEEPLMEAMLITCVAPNVYETKMLFETCTAPLRNALQPQRFTF